MAADIPTIAQLLDTSLIPSQNKQAEQALRSIETTPGFALNLLRLVATEEIPLTTRLAGALYFKNFIGRKWTIEDGTKRGLPESDVTTIKQEIVGLMISVRPNLQVQLGEAISIIAESDFFRQWDTLIDDLVSRLTPNNTKVNNGVLQVAHAIFKRWRPLFASNELYTEINHVLEKFPGPFLQLLNSTHNLIQQSSGNKEALQELFQTMNLIVKISFDLNCHDLSPAFEDNLTSIMNIFHTYLTYSNPVLETDDDEEAGPVERVKSGIFELLQLFAYKYSEDFENILPKFAEPTVALLMSLGPQAKYDITISKALQFLTAIVRSPKYAANFNSEDTLGQAVEKIILPNMTLRESDEELFEDDPIEYIRRDLGGSDSETRRRAVTDFLRQLLEQFDQLVTTVVGKYIQHYLKEYSTNPSDNWRSKDTALYLFSSIAAKASTEKKGVVKTNQYVDVVSFFQNNVASDLVASFDDVHPILKVDAIKFLNNFRSQFSKAQLLDAFPLVANHLSSPNYVVYTYTAVTIDRLLAMSKEGVPVFAAGDIEQYTQSILQHLFRLIERGGTPEKIAENEFLMRCVMRILLVAGKTISPIVESIMTELVKITGEISKNPSNPHFNHYTFESLGALIRFAEPAQSEAMGVALHGPFMAIIDNDVVEFTPYVYQLLSLLLENDAAAPLPARYNEIRERLLKSASWESRGNVPALVRLLRIIMARDAAWIVQNNKVEAVLGIFNYLIISKVTESHGFDLLESTFLIVPMNVLQQFVQPILNLLFQRLQDAKAGEVLKTRFARFFWFIAGRGAQGAGTDFLVKAIDSFGAGLFGQLVENIVLPFTKKLQQPADVKIVVPGLTDLIATSEGVATTYPTVWVKAASVLATVLENIKAKPVVEEAPTIDFDAEIDEVSFGATFSRLNTCKKRTAEQIAPDVGNPLEYVPAKIREANTTTGGRIQKLTTGAPENVTAAVGVWLGMA